MPLKLTVVSVLEKDAEVLEFELRLGVEEILAADDSGALELIRLDTVVCEAVFENWLALLPPPPQAERINNVKTMLNRYCSLSKSIGFTCCMEKPQYLQEQPC